METLLQKNGLPHLSSDAPFLTDGGIESTLVFHHGQNLPCYAAFTLLTTEEGTQLLRKAYEPYLQLAVKLQRGIVLESRTWRASDYWGSKMGYSKEDIVNLNAAAVQLLQELKAEYQEKADIPIVISGNVGPLGDAYEVEEEDRMTVSEAKRFYYSQFESFSKAAVDIVSIATTSSIVESIAVAELARDFNLPVVISFTLETDGKLKTGMTLAQAISEVDAATNAYAVYFGINCAHPCHFTSTLRSMPANILKRVGCIRANASKKSHQELDNSVELDDGDPVELGHCYASIQQILGGSLRVIGGCCGTDIRHVTAIAEVIFK